MELLTCPLVGEQADPETADLRWTRAGGGEGRGEVIAEGVGFPSGAMQVCWSQTAVMVAQRRARTACH